MDIGIFGGTFDPPHFGHLLVANEVREQCALEQIWFMPNRVPPHKNVQTVSHEKHRVKMLELAVSGNPAFYVSTLEIERSGPSYTYATLKHLTASYEHHRFYFIIGADMIHDLPNWKNIDEIVKLTTFIGVNRPNFTLQSPYERHIRYVDMPSFAVSSSFLRKRFRLRKTTRYFLPDPVREYIEVNRLYE